MGGVQGGAINADVGYNYVLRGNAEDVEMLNLFFFYQTCLNLQSSWYDILSVSFRLNSD